MKFHATTAITLLTLLAGCGDSAPPKQTPQQLFLKTIETHYSALKAAEKSDNQFNIDRAEEDAKTFLQTIDHRADGWIAKVKSVSGDTKEIHIKALHENSVFTIIIVDPAVRPWASALLSGDEIQFDADLGRERSFTIRGGLGEPEFRFSPYRIRKLSDASWQEQTAAMVKAQVAENKKLILGAAKPEKAPEIAKISSEEKNRRFEECRNKLIKAQKLKVLHDMDWQLPKEPKVVAGPTFFDMPIDGKVGFVETVNCFLVGGEDKCIRFDITHWQTGRPVGRFSYCKFEMN